MFTWFVGLIGLLASWHYTDLDSPSFLQSTLCPLLVGVFLIMLLIKIVFRLGGGSATGGTGSDGGGFFDSSGDGGGGCSGGGD